MLLGQCFLVLSWSPFRPFLPPVSNNNYHNPVIKGQLAVKGKGHFSIYICHQGDIQFLILYFFTKHNLPRNIGFSTSCLHGNRYAYWQDQWRLYFQGICKATVRHIHFESSLSSYNFDWQILSRNGTWTPCLLQFCSIYFQNQSCGLDHAAWDVENNTYSSRHLAHWFAYD